MNTGDIRGVGQEPKTVQEEGGGWFQFAVPSVFVQFGNQLREMVDFTGLDEQAFRIEIEEKLSNKDVERFNKPNIGDRKTKEAVQSEFRARMEKEVKGLEQEKKLKMEHHKTFRLKRDNLKLHKIITYLGMTDTRKIEKGRTVEEKQIGERKVRFVVSDENKAVIKENAKVSPMLAKAMELDMEIAEDKARPIEEIGSYQEEVYSAGKEYFDFVFNAIEKAVKDGKFKGFDKFDRKLYEENPIKFITDINVDMADMDLQFVVNSLMDSNEEFEKALQLILLKTEKYFDEAILAARKADKDYMDLARDHDKLEYILDEINETYMNNDEERDLALGNFDRVYGQEFENLRERCAQQEKAQFDEFFHELMKDDADYLAAKAVLEKYMKEGGELNFEEAFEDPEFWDAYGVVYDKFAAVCDVTGFTFKYNAGMTMDPHELMAQMQAEGKEGMLDYIKNHPGRFAYSPALVLGTAIMGWTFAPIVVGGVFAGHVMKRAVPAVQKELEMTGFYYDIRQARVDREVRLPMLGKIYAKDLSTEDKLESLKLLHEKGILYQEDMVEINEYMQDKLKEAIGEEAFKEIPSRASMMKARKPLLKVLNETFGNKQVRVDILKQMYQGGVLFLEDLEQEDENVQEAFLKELAIKKEEVNSIKALSKIRNRHLYLAKGVLVSDQEKLDCIKKLYNMGIWFKEDMVKLEKEFPDIWRKLIPQNGFDETRIKDTQQHYLTERSLKEDHDKLRAEILENPKFAKDGVPTLEGLMALRSIGLCFKQDIVKVPEEVAMAFAKSLVGIFSSTELDDLPDQETFYDYGVARQVVKFGQAMGNLLFKGGKAAYNNIYNDPVNIVYGPMKGIKGAVQIGAEALEETFGTFTDVETKALSDRVAKVLPGDKKLKAQAAFAFNKAVGTLKWSAIGAGIGGLLTSWFGLTSLPGMFYGGIVGGAFGAYITQGRVSQIPPGGFIRAIKFGAIGALVGAVCAGVLIFGGPALWAAGVVGLGTAIGLIMVGAGFAPLVILGAVIGYEIAGLTGKDQPKEIKDPLAELLYEEPSLESDFFARMPA